jgi:hypothetical protein
VRVRNEVKQREFKMEHESEHIERRMYEDMQAAAGEEMRVRLKLAGHEVGSAFVSVAGALPPSAIVANITYGLGLEQNATRDQVDEIVRHYAEAGVQRFFVQIHPQARPAEVESWLESACLEQTRGWMMLKHSEGLLATRLILATQQLSGWKVW